MRPRHQIGVLALPAQPRRLPQRLFHHRRGIDENLYTNVAKPPPRRLRHQPAGEVFQRLFHRIVVIRPLRINRNARPIPHLGQRQRIASRRVTHPQRDHALRLWPQGLRVGALVRAGLHPAHLAVHAGAQPFGEGCPARRIIAGGRNSAGRKTLR